MALTKHDLEAVRTVVRDETKQLATKDDLTSTEHRLVEKIEAESEKLAQITIKEFQRVHRRTEALARHVGYTFDPESDG